MIAWIFLLIGSVLAFLALETLIFPKLFLTTEYSVGKTADRGIKKYKTSSDGLYMIYEPDWMVRRFIKQYIVAQEQDKKFLKCMVDFGVDYVEYDAVLFNTSDKVFRVLNIRQIVENGVYTDEIELPEGTAYVTLMLRRVNNRVFPQTARIKISPKRLVKYGIFTCLAAMVASVGINVSISQLFGGVFRESYIANIGSWIAVIGVALVAAVVGSLLISLLIASRKFKNKKK